jgi:hypothetical protein
MPSLVCNAVVAFIFTLIQILLIIGNVLCMQWKVKLNSIDVVSACNEADDMDHAANGGVGNASK